MTRGPGPEILYHPFGQFTHASPERVWKKSAGHVKKTIACPGKTILPDLEGGILLKGDIRQKTWFVWLLRLVFTAMIVISILLEAGACMTRLKAGKLGDVVMKTTEKYIESASPGAGQPQGERATDKLFYLKMYSSLTTSLNDRR
jgi:hypothetical protein